MKRAACGQLTSTITIDNRNARHNNNQLLTINQGDHITHFTNTGSLAPGVRKRVKKKLQYICFRIVILVIELFSQQNSRVYTLSNLGIATLCIS